MYYIRIVTFFIGYVAIFLIPSTVIKLAGGEQKIISWTLVVSIIFLGISVLTKKWEQWAKKNIFKIKRKSAQNRRVYERQKRTKISN
jgi:hypothetical protein